MSKIFTTSDLHLNHANILKYCPNSRPYASIPEMNEAIVENWNKVVGAEDTVYVLGDLSMGEVKNAIPYIQRLNGKIILIRGNHDNQKRIDVYRELGIEVKDIEYLRYKGRFFVMCHFPNMNEEFARMVKEDNSEVIWLYGHVHDHAPRGYDADTGSFHVGLDTNDMTPVALEDIWKQSWPKSNDTFVNAYHKFYTVEANADKEFNE